MHTDSLWVMRKDCITEIHLSRGELQLLHLRKLLLQEQSHWTRLLQNIYTYRTFKDEAVLTLNAKIALEGLYDTLSNKLLMNDTVTAYVRNAAAPYNIVDSARSNIDSVNFNGNFRFYNLQSGTYYVSLRHRNGIETWSRAGGESFINGGSNT